MSEVVFKDRVTLNIEQAQLNNAALGEFFESPRKVIPLTDGIHYWFRCYPGGKDEGGHIAVFLHVSAPITVKCVIKFARFKETLYADFDDVLFAGFAKLATHARARAHLVQGILSVRCKLEVRITVPNTIAAPRIGEFASHVANDVEIKVGEDSLLVKRSILTLLSQTFVDQLRANADGANPNIVNITDVSFRVVKTAFDFYNGVALNNPSVDTIIDILRFSDRYGIHTGLLADRLLPMLTVETFASIVTYAHAAAKEHLFGECCDTFQRSMVKITQSESFQALSPALIVCIVKRSFELTTDFQVLQFCRVNGFGEALDPYENLLVERLTLETFYDASRYAYECTRPLMMAKCGALYNEHKDEVTTSRVFLQLPAAVTHAVMTAGSDLLL